MANEAVVLTTHVYIARMGDSIDGNTIGLESKPDVTPEANWTDLGICKNFGIEDASTTEDLMKGVPGRVVLGDVIKTASLYNYNFDMGELNPFAVQAAFGTAAISTTFVPGGQGRRLKAWFKIQQYNQDNELVISADVPMDVVVTGLASPLGGLTSYTIAGRQLYSTLTTGNLGNL